MVKYSGDLNGVFDALSDPTRREMITRLTQGSMTVSELAQPFRMSLPAVTKHIQVLERVGLVHSVKTGRTRRCDLVVKPLADALDWISTHRVFWEQRLDRLEQVLLQQEENEENERNSNR